MALLVIDVQREFCDPRHPERRGNAETVRISNRIAMTVPKFRSAGIPVYAIYYDETLLLEPHQVDWFKFRPAPGDILVPKNRNSAFEGSPIKEILEKNGYRTLLTCGFNRSSCVYATARDARKAGFDVLLLSDLTGNDNTPHSLARLDFKYLARKGAAIADSATVLDNPPLASIFSKANARNTDPAGERLPGGFSLRSTMRALGSAIGHSFSPFK